MYMLGGMMNLYVSRAGGGSCMRKKHLVGGEGSRAGGGGASSMFVWGIPYYSYLDFLEDNRKWSSLRGFGLGETCVPRHNWKFKSVTFWLRFQGIGPKENLKLCIYEQYIKLDQNQ